MTQKRAVLIHFAVEVWNHAQFQILSVAVSWYRGNFVGSGVYTTLSQINGSRSVSPVHMFTVARILNQNKQTMAQKSRQSNLRFICWTHCWHRDLFVVNFNYARNLVYMGGLVVLYRWLRARVLTVLWDSLSCTSQCENVTRPIFTKSLATEVTKLTHSITEGYAQGREIHRPYRTWRSFSCS